MKKKWALYAKNGLIAGLIAVLLATTIPMGASATPVVSAFRRLEGHPAGIPR